MTGDPFARAWIEIRGDAVVRNLRGLCSALGPGVSAIPMVKANAYGLGVAEAVRVLDPEAPFGFGVATVEEGEELRRLGVRRPVLVFTPTPPASFDRGVAAELTLSISDLEGLDHLSAVVRRSGRKASFQVEVDTGMGRAGFPWNRAEEWGPWVTERYGRGSGGEGLSWVGTYTHFHSADEAGSGESSMALQAERFRQVVQRIDPDADSDRWAHLGNSAASLRRPELVGFAVRPGIHLYGGVAGEGLAHPEPVVSLRARVVLVREVDPGTTLGYGATYQAKGQERWATLAIGYGDGLPRALSPGGSALLHGHRVPMVGRISMDTTVVNISGVPGVQAGDVATLLGSEGNQSITLEALAMQASTISYEILTGLSPRLPRVWREMETR